LKQLAIAQTSGASARNRRTQTTRKPKFLQLFGMAEEAAEKCMKTFLQGLKPIGFEGFTQGLKPLPPKENDFFRNL